jgi:conserved oligomeric Golgi complex subunit 6
MWSIIISALGFFAAMLPQVLDTKTESSEVAASLATLSTFYHDNTATSRRHLRSTIENETLKVNEDFLLAVEDVTVALDAVQADLDGTAERCERMTSTVSESSRIILGLLQESERLQQALETSYARSELLSQFRQQYQLSREESDALQAETIDERFFAALDHVLAIHKNCKALLRTHHQRAGLELLDSMASLQESAYERLCRWVREHARVLADLDAPEVEPLMQKATTALQARPILHAYCAEELAVARQGAVFQRFIRALTRGKRPIEMHAPDPWRYASDMLAWVHTSLASERDLFTALFGSAHAFERGETDTADDREATAEVPLIPRMLDTVFESVCKPLRVRLEQVLLTSPPPLLSFRLSQLLLFYLNTVDALLGPLSQLSEALRACRALAMRTFSENLKHRGDKLSKYPPPPPADLSLPRQMAESCTLVSDLIESYEGSITGATHETDDANGSDFDDVLAAVLDPLVAAIERSSEALDPLAAGRVDDGSHLDPTDQKVYVINCLHELQRPLLGHACAVKRAEVLSASIAQNIEILAVSEAHRILANCGLVAIAEHFASFKNVEDSGEQQRTSATDPRLSLHTVAEAMRTFFGKLSEPLEFRKLQTPDIKIQAVQRSLFALAKAYGEVYDALMDHANGYDAAEVTKNVPHTPADVRTLLGVVV